MLEGKEELLVTFHFRRGSKQALFEEDRRFKLVISVYRTSLLCRLGKDYSKEETHYCRKGALLELNAN
jgi:hypothetical protein